MRVRRASIVDEYVEDGRAAVFVGEMVCVLSELATSAWLEVEEGWTTAERVSEVLTEVYGAPPTGETLDATVTVLQELADRGLLEVDGPG